MHWQDRDQRRPAINAPGHAHELTFSCFRAFKFLAAERTCEWLAESIDEARKTFDFALWAFVFMPEHVHLIIHPHQAEYDIRVILKAIKEPVGRKAVKYLVKNKSEWLPRITVRRGKRIERRFWQAGGGYDRNIIEPKTLWSMIEYIHQNPVRRGLVVHATEWKWSSAGWYAGKPTNWLIPDPLPSGVLDE
jgi:putative transposase